MTHISREYPLCPYGMMKPITGLTPEPWATKYNLPFFLHELIKRRVYSQINSNFVFRIKTN